LELEIRNYYKN